MSDGDEDKPGARDFGLAVDFPADWPDELCKAQLVMLIWETYDLRAYRHLPQLRNSIWTARRSSARAFKDMLAAWERGDGFSRAVANSTKS